MELAEKISVTLKSLRKEKGWSLDKTSESTKVSKAMLGQIERGESSPTISTLWKIASGFNVSFSSFIEGVGSQESVVVQKGGDVKQIHPKDNKMLVMPLFPYDESLRFEVFILDLLPGCEHVSTPHQKGVTEHIVVTEGDIEVLIGGNWVKLKEKEGLKFNADQTHGYRNLGKKKATFHNMIHYN